MGGGKINRPCVALSVACGRHLSHGERQGEQGAMESLPLWGRCHGRLATVTERVVFWGKPPPLRKNSHRPSFRCQRFFPKGHLERSARARSRNPKGQRPKGCRDNGRISNTKRYARSFDTGVSRSAQDDTEQLQRPRPRKNRRTAFEKADPAANTLPFA